MFLISLSRMTILDLYDLYHSMGLASFARQKLTRAFTTFILNRITIVIRAGIYLLHVASLIFTRTRVQTIMFKVDTGNPKANKCHFVFFSAASIRVFKVLFVHFRQPTKKSVVSYHFCCQLSVQKSLVCQLSVAFLTIYQLSVNPITTLVQP